jgi:hypothetical protein
LFKENKEKERATKIYQYSNGNPENIMIVYEKVAKAV